MVTMAAASLIATVVAAGASYASQRSQAKAAQENARVQRQYEEYNSAVRKQKIDASAEIARRDNLIIQANRRSLVEAGESQEAAHRRMISQAVGASRAAQSASGFQIDDTLDSTFFLLNNQIVADGELDILNLRHNRQLKDYELKLLGEDTIYQETLLRHASAADIATPVYQPADTSKFSLLSSMADIGDKGAKAGFFSGGAVQMPGGSSYDGL